MLGDAVRRFEFATATRIIFGAGTAGELPALVRGLGSQLLLVTGRTPNRWAGLLEGLAGQGIAWKPFAVAGEPTTDMVVAGAGLGRQAGCDVVVGLGGGSALDAAKAIAALLTNPGDLFDYLEVVGRGQALRQSPAPLVLVPTTAGTGTEVTRNAVLTVTQHQVKASLRSPLLLARLAVVDPALGVGLPPEVTAYTGLDALTQLIEPFTSCRANPFIDALCREGIRRVAKALVTACRDGSNLGARADMSLASLWSGMALANAGLGAVHGFAAPLGGMFPVPHGAACAALLAPTMAANLDAARAQGAGTPTEARYREIAELLTGQSGAEPEAGIAWVRRVSQELGIRRLAQFGVRREDFPRILERAARASSMKGNPIELSPERLQGILAQAC
jgi:alcohol dehydrogenase class IV